MSNDPFAPPQEVSSQGATGQRPVGVTVFAILNIIFGILGVLGSIFTALMMAVGPMIPAGGPPNPVLDMMNENLFYNVFLFGSLILGFVFAVILIVAGSDLLKMRSRGRTLSIVYGVYAVISSVVGTLVNVFVVFLPMMEQAPNQQGAQAAMIGGMVGGAIGGCIGLIYPVAVLIYFLRAQTKAAFEAADAASRA